MSADAPPPDAQPPAPMSVDGLQSALDAVVSPWVLALGLRVQALRADGVDYTLPVSPALVHGGGVLSGQAVMAAADTALLGALIAALGGFRPMTTVQLSTSFLAAVPGDAATVRVEARVTRMGRRLCFGEVWLRRPDGSAAAHATSTYSLL